MLVPNLADRPPTQVNVDRGFYRAAGKGRRGAASAEQCLVNIVVKDFAKLFRYSRQRLRDSVSAKASQMVSGCQMPFRSTTPTTPSAASSVETVSNSIDDT
jgi:hypothetical protein